MSLVAARERLDLSMNRRGLNVLLELVAIALFAVKVLLHRELLNILLELLLVQGIHVTLTSNLA